MTNRNWREQNQISCTEREEAYALQIGRRKRHRHNMQYNQNRCRKNGKTADISVGRYISVKKDFLDDIRKSQLFVGSLDDSIAVIYVVNEESEAEYQNGNWQYAGCDYCVIHRLCVNPAYQGYGIAKQTLVHIEEELRKSNIKAVRLDVFSQNPTAYSLYLGMGYEKVGFADWRKGRFYLMEKLLR